MNYSLNFQLYSYIFFLIKNIPINWYGLMYIFIFLIYTIHGAKKSKIPNFFLTKKEIENLLFYGFLGMLVGGRIGYIILYNIKFFIINPIYILKIWMGGMSFHGGLIGTAIALLFFSYRIKKNFFCISDFIIPLVPLGITLGRLGNFINGELWGRISVNNNFSILFHNSKYADLKETIIHPQYKVFINKFGTIPRHPSQLYELLLEGIILFLLLNTVNKKNKKPGYISSLFLIFYGILRFICEYFREPDYQIKFIINYFTIGQILSFPMIILGIVTIAKCYINSFIKKLK
ncbi:prolipoprotein diacylglyceryl transferase [Buchnera aphidicola (Neophyllaphis podocarpi)]|uniref:prolipoprotein diacylglyceryl transferase n=1 Tax=Buchnera aphidicola TaxID=9 RepID=UPI0031B8640E